MQLIKFILIIFALFLAYRTVYLLSKRLSLVRKIRAFSKKNDARVRFCRFPLLSLVHLSERPDAIVETKNQVYVIRTISGGSGMRRVHFASKEFFVSFRRFSLMPTGRMKAMQLKRSSTVIRNNTSTSGWRVKILPTLEIPEEYSNTQKTVVPVIILNPAPHELSYVTENRSSIKLAFTGDDLYEYKIFTASTFVRYAERAIREQKAKTDGYYSYFQ